MVEIISTITMARKSPTIPASSTAAEKDILFFDDAPEFMDGREAAEEMENVDARVKEAQEQLLRLRQQQEEIERQKKHLEELRQKQERFGQGKRDLIEKLSRSTSTLDRELYDAQKLVEELSIARDSFNHHLEILKGIQPEKWHRSQVDEELDGALAAIEDAEDEYAKSTRRIHSVRQTEAPTADAAESGEDEEEGTLHRFATATGTDDFPTWFRRGLAFNIPLVAGLIVLLVLARLMF